MQHHGDIDAFIKATEKARRDRAPIEHNDRCRICHANIRWWSYPKRIYKAMRPRFLLCAACAADYFARREQA
jgi:hypothetical protein